MYMDTQLGVVKKVYYFSRKTITRKIRIWDGF